MKKIQDFVFKSKEIFVGLEDPKKSWKVCVRSGRLAIKGTSINYQQLSVRYREQQLLWSKSKRNLFIMIVGNDSVKT